MHAEELVALFDQQAAGYDSQWAKTAAIRDCMHLMLVPLLAGLPAEARLLCVGAGTGAEVAHLAHAFPRWRFTAVEPSARMLDACRRRADADGFADRCTFHHGFVDSLPAGPAYDAATCFLVSQFVLARAARVRLFADIATRLHAHGLLAHSDLASDVGAPAYATLLPAWCRMMAAAEVPAATVERIRAGYARDVAILPPADIASMLVAGGFADPVQFFQAGLIHAWVSRRA